MQCAKSSLCLFLKKTKKIEPSDEVDLTLVENFRRGFVRRIADRRAKAKKFARFRDPQDQGFAVL
jgi:hypothetical protein